MKMLSALVITAVLAVSPLHAETLKNTLAAYDGMTLGQATSVSDVKLTSGHIAFTLASGTAAPVVAGNETIGLFFTGKGSYEYVTSDPAEAAIVKTNVKRATDLAMTEAANGITIGDTFDQLLYIQPKGSLPQLSNSSTISVDEAFNQFKQMFARDNGGSFAHLYAIKKLDDPADVLTMAQMRGGKEAAVYTYDDVLRHFESLDVLRESHSSNAAVKKHLYRTAVSQQLISRDWKTYAVQNFLLSGVDLDLTASDKRDVKYTCIETVVPQNAPRASSASISTTKKSRT